MDLASKCEASGKVLIDALAILDSASPPAAIPCLTGLDDDPNQTPCFTVKADVNEEAVKETGNDHVFISVKVWTRIGGNKGESLILHRARVALVFALFRKDTTAADLSAAVPEFYVEDIWKVGESQDTTAVCLVSELVLEAIACPSAIS